MNVTTSYFSVAQEFFTFVLILMAKLMNLITNKQILNEQTLVILITNIYCLLYKVSSYRHFLINFMKNYPKTLYITLIYIQKKFRYVKGSKSLLNYKGRPWQLSDLNHWLKHYTPFWMDGLTVSHLFMPIFQYVLFEIAMSSWILP